jgi:hypothetical protein
MSIPKGDCDRIRRRPSPPSQCFMPDGPRWLCVPKRSGVPVQRVVGFGSASQDFGALASWSTPGCEPVVRPAGSLRGDPLRAVLENKFFSLAL